MWQPSRWRLHEVITPRPTTNTRRTHDTHTALTTRTQLSDHLFGLCMLGRTWCPLHCSSVSTETSLLRSREGAVVRSQRRKNTHGQVAWLTARRQRRQRCRGGEGAVGLRQRERQRAAIGPAAAIQSHPLDEAAATTNVAGAVRFVHETNTNVLHVFTEALQFYGDDI